MDALSAIAERHSTRSYQNKPIPKRVLEQIVDAGRLAPTARNEQPWDFVVVTDQTTKKLIAEFTNYGKFIAEAAACVVVLCRDTFYYIEDGCAATENMLVAAAGLGVQSCWVAGDKKAYCSEILKILKVPAGHKLVTLVALGYEKTPVERKVRRELSDVLHWERF